MDLKRHLQTHVKREEMDDAELVKFFHVADNARKRRAPRRQGNKKGLPKKWCPLCKFVTAHLRKHLANKHHIKKGGYMDTYIKVARLYRGKDEIDDLPPLALKQETDNATPPTASETANPDPTPNPKAEDNEPSYASEEEYEVEDEEEYGLQEEFFTTPNPKNNRHKWLVLFYRWLNTADAGRKKDRNRLQHACHIKKMLEDLQPGGTDIDVLSEDEGQIVWTDWVDLKLMTLKSGTINGYLGTYQSFLTFVVEDCVRVSDFPPLEDDVRRNFRNIIPKLRGWRKTVDLEGKVDTNQRRMDECTHCLTTEDVN